MDKFYIRKGSLQPHYQAQALDGAGAAIDISAAEVWFYMTNPLNGSVVTSAAAVVDSGSLGTMRYPWVASDVATPGIYKATFEVFSLSGGPFKIPRLPSEEAFVIVLDY